MDINTPVPALGDRSLSQVFASAASGNAADQEMMCALTIHNAERFTRESVLDMSELWARMALSQGSKSIRPTLSNILTARAMGNAEAENWPDFIEHTAEAVTLLDEMVGEGDMVAMQSLDRLFGGPFAQFYPQCRDAVLKRAKEMQAV